jgi:putative PIN family toxin of toxin-antitoxin system
VRLVLDTNVVISALISPGGTPSQIMKMVLGRGAELCYNSVILSEYENVMLRPKFSSKINSGSVSRLINLIKSLGISFDPLPSNIKLQDESDRVFYDTARGSGSVLITGNKKHFPKESFIMLPAEFFKLIENGKRDFFS